MSNPFNKMSDIDKIPQEEVKQNDKGFKIPFFKSDNK